MDAALRALRHRFGSTRGRWWLPGPIGGTHQPIDNRKHGDKEEEFGHGVKSPWRIGRGERIRTSDSCVPNAVLYQAELRPDGKLVARKHVAGTGRKFQPES